MAKKNYVILLSLCVTVISGTGCLQSGLTSAVAAEVQTDSAAYLRTDCTNAPTPCFTSIDSIMDYLWLSPSPRNPSAAAPVLVDIGAGIFAGQFVCDASKSDRGYVTLRGAGRDNSVIENTAAAAVFVIGCKQLSFQDITLRGTTGGIVWQEGGDSTYSNVAVIGDSRLGNQGLVFAWYDECNETGVKSTHTWFGSSVTSFSNFFSVAYFSFCSETWFYGGDIAAVALAGSKNIVETTAVRMVDKGDMRVFGSSLRSVAQDGVTFAGGSGMKTVNIGATDITGVSGGGNFHMHGGAIASDPRGPAGQNANINTVGIIAGDTAQANQQVHVVETAYAMSASIGGKLQRLVGKRTQSPFQWPADKEPPVIETTHGSDMFIETDCDNTGNCDSGIVGEPHLMIYSQPCADKNSANPWFDVVLGDCRK